jgi:hypothetical protein
VQVAEILKDRPSWFRDCRAVDVVNALSTGSGGTIELLYMQVRNHCFTPVISGLLLSLYILNYELCFGLALCAYNFGTSS